MTVPCWSTNPAFRVWALPDIFLPWTTTLFNGLCSAAIPRLRRAVTTPPQIKGYESFGFVGTIPASRVTE